MLDKIFCRVSLTDTLQLYIYFTLGNSPVAIYLLPGGMYYTLKYAFTGFLHWETNSQFCQ